METYLKWNFSPFTYMLGVLKKKKKLKWGHITIKFWNYWSNGILIKNMYQQLSHEIRIF